MQILAIGEDNEITVGTADQPLRYTANGELVEGATVSAQLKTEALVNVGSPVTCEESGEEGEEGIYRGSLSGVGLERDVYYWLDITISGSGSGFRRIKCQGRYHQETP